MHRLSSWSILFLRSASALGYKPTRQPSLPYTPKLRLPYAMSLTRHH